MKRTAIALSVALSALTALGQGSLNFNTKIGANTPVTFGGVNVTGPTYVGALFVANPAAGGAFQQVSSAVAFGSVSVLRGYITTGGTITVNFLAPGATAQVMLKAWNAAAGATYDEAAGKVGVGIVGMSTPVGIVLKNPNANPPDTPAALVDLNGFAMATVVPEPSTIALGLLGAAGLFLRRRK